MQIKPFLTAVWNLLINIGWDELHFLMFACGVSLFLNCNVLILLDGSHSCNHWGSHHSSWQRLTLVLQNCCTIPYYCLWLRSTCSWVFANSIVSFGSIFTFNFALERKFPEMMVCSPSLVLSAIYNMCLAYLPSFNKFHLLFSATWRDLWRSFWWVSWDTLFSC